MKKAISVLLSVLFIFSIFSFTESASVFTAPTSVSAAEKIEGTRKDLSKAKVTGLASREYTGKKITPTVKVVVAGKTLINRTDYYVRYSGNIKVGTAKVKITGKGNYKGTVNKTFKIIPRSTQITKITPHVKRISICWNKKKTQVTGYQIQFSTYSSFKNKKWIRISSNAKGSRTIKGLKGRKKYFVRIRTYKEVKSKRYYSKWSEAESTKTYLKASDDKTTYKVNFVAVGDNLIHQELIESGEKADGTKDYHAFYEKTKRFIQQADIASVNQETILGGDVAPLTGFPRFNSPQEIGDAIADTGFDIMTLATNHFYDAGMEGINAALDFMKTKHPEVKTLGLYRSAKENRTITYIVRNNIRIALLNYTYRPETSQNYARPADKPYLFTNLNERDRIERDVKEAKKHSDLIIAYPHWGQEYNMNVTSYMKKCTKMFSELGVDIVIGTHPHVIAPVEWVKNKKTGKKMLVYYSLGNYVSFQDTSTPKMLEGMAQFTIKKKNGKITVVNPKLMPMVNYITRKESNPLRFNITAVPLKEYTNEMAKKHLQPELGERKKFVELFEKTVDKEFRGEY